ncbi:MAG: glycosyltransferase [Endomicrobiales bacterium]|nr:glycosyltransferase [Endomicrobiales bacterium]
MLYLLITLLSLSFLLLIIYVTLLVAHSKAKNKELFGFGTLPKVSILKPISGLDDGLEENIESFFTIDYPSYEIVFGLDTQDPACLKAVEKAREKFPDVPSKVVSVLSKKILNPKITTLINMEPSATGQLYWITDSNIRVERDTLKNLVHEYLSKGSKIVFSPIRGDGGNSLGSIIENSYMNFFVSSNIIAAWKFLKMPLIVGKSMLIEKAKLEELGGFERFREYLAEDFVMGEIYAKEKVHISTNYTWVTNYASSASVKKVYDRLARWAKLRFNIKREHYFCEVLLNPVILSLIFAIFLGKTAVTIYVAAFLFKVVLEYIVLFAVSRIDRKNFKVLFLLPVAVFLKDIMLFIVYLAPFINSSVNWRGRQIRIGAQSKILYIEGGVQESTESQVWQQQPHKEGTHISASGLAWVISAIMGLGHMRAATPLKDIACGQKIVVEGKDEFSSAEECLTWARLKKIYYVMSSAKRILVIGRYIIKLLNTMEKIPYYYPTRDHSKPTWAVKYLKHLINNENLCKNTIMRVRQSPNPVVSSFYASSIAVDMRLGNTVDNYLIVCDSDINRVWVSEYPSRSSIKYLIPCTQIKKRLMSYGVPEENILLTGFPLPKENIGSKEDLEILKEDIFNRLLRLDPYNKFFSIYKKDVFYLLNKEELPDERESFFTVAFAVGGAGSQTEIAQKLLHSLRGKIVEGKIKVFLSAGVRVEVRDKFIEYIKALKLTEYIGDAIKIVFDEDITNYLFKFNKMLRTIDVLWTKPSELSFYCALGIPIIIAPSIGAHEDSNARWLDEIHAGIFPPGPVEYADEWLFDLREKGRLADAAWAGFLKARKLGTYKIEELVKTGKFLPGAGPLEQ